MRRAAGTTSSEPRRWDHLREGQSRVGSRLATIGIEAEPTPDDQAPPCIDFPGFPSPPLPSPPGSVSIVAGTGATRDGLVRAFWRFASKFTDVSETTGDPT
jgi:hypothetical protein